MVVQLTADEAYTILKPLFFYLLGVVAYAVFVFKFYKFLARKDIFEMDLQQYNTSNHPGVKKFFRVIFYIIQYILIMPLFTFFWFGVLTVLLAFLAKDESLQSILLISIAVVGAVRMCAYYSEDLSNDLAKMLPFALLGIFLVSSSYFTFSEAFEVIKQIPSHLNIILYYLIFTIVLELVLRIGYFIFSPMFGGRSREREN